MSITGAFTLNEILSQPEAWVDTLRRLESARGQIAAFLAAGQFDSVLYTGCGSTYYLAMAGAATMRDLARVPALALPGSEIWLNGHSSYIPGSRPLLVIVSRSGETTESLRACETFRAQTGGQVLTICCYPSSALAQAGDLNLLIPAGQEESVAQTRAFTTLYLATQALAAVWAGREDLLAEMQRLPEACQRLQEQYGALAGELGRSLAFDRFYFLGSGLRYGLACEASLKMKEMSLSHSEPFHFLEFRHGPKSMVTTSTLVVGLVSENNFEREMAVLADMEQLGATVFSLAETGARVDFRSGLCESVRGALYLPLLQRLAFEHALSRGLNPDLPNNLTAVIRLDGQ